MKACGFYYDAIIDNYMRILVTGGAGFIGSNLIRLLLTKKNESVVNLDKLTYAGNSESLSDLADHPEYSFEQVDLCDAGALDAVFRKHQPHAVMHLAAESHVDRSIDGPSEFIQSNIIGTFNLLQTALAYWRSLPEGGTPAESSGMNKHITDYPPTKNSFRLLHVSTDEVYGSLLPEADGFSETTRYDPHSPYSASKAASDHLVRAWGDTYGLPILITNCSNNYGPFQFPEKLIPVVILKCLNGAPIPVYGKGENIRDWLYVNDHAEALYTVLTTGQKGETYNIGGNNEQTNLDLVRNLCQLMDELAPIPQTTRNSLTNSSNDQSLAITQAPLQSYQDLITFVKDRPGHDLRYAIDATKIHNELGWSPKEDLNSGFRKTVQWYLENTDWWQRILNGEYKLERLGQTYTNC